MIHLIGDFSFDLPQTGPDQILMNAPAVLKAMPMARATIHRNAGACGRHVVCRPSGDDGIELI
jgi:hypothetical protein